MKKKQIVVIVLICVLILFLTIYFLLKLIGVIGFCGFSTYASCNSDSECKIGGCSRQVCESKDEGTITTCEYRECFNSEKYGLSCKCVSGKCRWD